MVATVAFLVVGMKLIIELAIALLLSIAYSISTMNAEPLKLIKSSIYVVNGTPCRYTGEMQNGQPVFKNHDAPFIIGGEVTKADKDAINAYLGR